MQLLCIDRFKPYLRFWLVWFLFLILDQGTKFWVVSSIPVDTYLVPGPPAIIDDFFYIVHVHNTGASWGLLSGFSLGFAILAIIALSVIFCFRKTLELKKTYLQWTFGLLCSGIVGNLIDRLAYGYVIDFIDIHLPGYRWPAFNVADSCICIGVVLYFLYSLLGIGARSKT